MEGRLYIGGAIYHRESRVLDKKLDRAGIGACVEVARDYAGLLLRAYELHYLHRTEKSCGSSLMVKVSIYEPEGRARLAVLKKSRRGNSRAGALVNAVATAWHRGSCGKPEVLKRYKLESVLSVSKAGRLATVGRFSSAAYDNVIGKMLVESLLHMIVDLLEADHVGLLGVKKLEYSRKSVVKIINAVALYRNAKIKSHYFNFFSHDIPPKTAKFYKFII